MTSVNRHPQRDNDAAPAGSVHEISRPGYAALLFFWPLALGLPGIVYSLVTGHHVAAAVICALTALMAKGTWNVVKYERATPLMRIEGASLTWFGDIPKHRFSVQIADIRSWHIEYFGMRKNPYYEMTIRTHGGQKIRRVFSAAAKSASAELYPLLEHHLGHRFTPPFQTPAVS